MKIPQHDINRMITLAIEEDRAHSDITTKILIEPQHTSHAYIIAKEDAIICGNTIIKKIFQIFGSPVTVVSYHEDGDRVKKNEPVLYLKGSTAALLSCERIALNFLGQLSGISTLTAHFVNNVKKTKAKIFDTRKTTPGYRNIEKYAVRCGGGENHRNDLNAMVLIKDNHLAVTHPHRSLPAVVENIRIATRKAIELEVDTLEQFRFALTTQADLILLDNMTMSQLRTAVKLRRRLNHKILLEASGGIRLSNVEAIAKTGVDRISVGQITHSAPCIDFSMEFVI